MYRLTNETLSASVTDDNYTASYTYDLVGNRSAKTHSSVLSPQSSTYTYNANDQLLQETSASPAPSAVTSYSYDANGSLTNQLTQSSVPSTQSYAYDLENRLSGANIYRLEGTNTVAITAGYLYNPSGIRVRSDSQTQINQLPTTPVTNHKFFLVDSMNHTGYAQVLEERSALNSGPSTLDRSYTIGDDVLSQSDGTLSPATHFLGYDGHGSTRILTDSSGAIATGARYNYDAYGVQLSAQSPVVSPALTSLLYTGEQFDTGLQQYYLRARYYNQSTGRFIQFDPFRGDNFDPQSLHKYAYAHDDPVNRIDPSGLITLLDMAIGIGFLVAAATYFYVYVRNGRNAAHAGIVAILAGALTTAAIVWYPIVAAAIVASGVPGITVLSDHVIGSIYGLGQEVLDSSKSWEERMSAAFLLLSYGAPTAAPEVNAFIPRVNRICSRVAPKIGSPAISEAADSVFLGLDSPALSNTASSNGGRTLMGASNLKLDFSRALANPQSKFSIVLDGVIGANTRAKIMRASQLGAAGPGNNNVFNWEIFKLVETGRISDAVLYEGGAVVPNPFAP